MKTRAKHGLWVAHRVYLRTFQIPLALDMVRNGNNTPTYGIPTGRYAIFHRTPSQIVAQCVYRYMRRHGLTSAQDWNALCKVVISRCGSRHGDHAMRRALEVEAPDERFNRLTRPVQFDLDDRGNCYGARARYSKFHTAARQRLKERQEYLAAFEHVCVQCGERAEYESYKGVKKRYFEANPRSKRDKIFYYQSLCLSCWGKTRRLFKQHQDVLETRQFIQDITRSIKNERKNQNDGSVA